MEVAISSDGRIGYLEAQDIMASGLTVDELKAKLDQELAKFRRVHLERSSRRFPSAANVITSLAK